MFTIFVFWMISDFFFSLFFCLNEFLVFFSCEDEFVWFFY